MPRVTKRHGVGAKVSVLTKYLHPSEAIRNRHHNRALPANHRTKELVIIRQDTGYVKRKNQICYIFHHDDYKHPDNITPIELHCVRKHAKVTEEGLPKHVFAPDDAAAVDLDQHPERTDIQNEQLPTEVLRFNFTDDAHLTLVNNGITVEGDNKPLEPQDEHPQDACNAVFSQWGFDGICPRRVQFGAAPSDGNEYHTVCCGESGILWQLELVEGKDQVTEHDFDNRGGKVVGLLLRLSRPIWFKGNVLVLDSGFCFLQGVAELRKNGVYAVSLIKKRRYWPKYIDGEGIKSHFDTLDIGDVDCLNVKLDNIDVKVVCMKYPDYVMMLMTSYGSLEQIPGTSTRREYKNAEGRIVRKEFLYTELIYNHYHYRHAVDDHNNRRHSPIPLEEIWVTQWWPNRVFAFLLGVTEVNMKLATEYFGQSEKLSMISFRKLFAEAMIFNREIADCRKGCFKSSYSSPTSISAS